MNKPFPKGATSRLHSVLAIALLCGLLPVSNAQEAAISADPAQQKKQETRQIGDVTSSLLLMQARGSVAGPALPMLGATSSLSWDRYKDSFKHKIPETFERAVTKSNTGGQ